MVASIENEIKKAFEAAGVAGDISLTASPNPDMGDVAFACFGLAKEWKKSPNEVAEEIKEKLEKLKKLDIVERIEAMGPYVNFFLNGRALAEEVLKAMAKEKKKYGAHAIGKKKKVMVEFAHPNTHKAFHIGHLRNIVSGESIVRLLENSGHKVVRANYQGDVGMHIAKCLWAIEKGIGDRGQGIAVKDLSLEERIAFLGKAYAQGAKAFEESEAAKSEIMAYNEKIYANDPSIRSLYKKTRAWSLEYFNHIYERVGTRFDRLYFESETFKPGLALVKKFLRKGVFEESQGAIIFPGSRYGLHDRVFVNSRGFPTYEAKDVALADIQMKEYKPDRIIHVVGKEQTEYFKVVFKAIESISPKTKGRESHLAYGWVHLKEGKMSSRTGNVILGEWLLDEVEKEIRDIQRTGDSFLRRGGTENDAARIALAAVKYAFLKTGVQNDIAFDLKESVSTSGDSGPYLLYIVARIRSILRKSKVKSQKSKVVSERIEPSEKQLLLKLAEFPEATKKAAEALDPSQVAKHLFDLAQAFNTFYDMCPVLQAEEDVVRAFRLRLIESVEQVMTMGLYLLGIETVDQM